jgi:2-(3-amino-3-carboxypropyl)histidine synthase
MEDDRLEVDVGVAADIEESQPLPRATKQPKKRFIGRRAATEAAKSIQNDAEGGHISGSLQRASRGVK